MRDLIQEKNAKPSNQENKNWFAKEVLSFKEALKLLDISASTLYKLTHKKAITYYKPSGKMIYFKRVDLINWMLQNKQTSTREVKQQMFNQLKIAQ
ncbi:helix-turn-helix domain-containing protein [Mesonia sp. K7]|uniref:helix-turn-helix domain-containing protein n=1 Tax=Mesonia sp. K7 TaxID=2218606 RepID=UPI000DAA4980|nr:helix-turn-helix domain-containing protein [Mesonia sp. K7]PZD77462.1 DNA-binding protein [Mesonia sp. K7]